MPIEKRWVVRPQGDPRAVEELSSRLSMSPVLTNLLVQRGIDTVEKAKKFFSPQLSDLHDPFLMKDMDKAVARVEQAVRDQLFCSQGRVCCDSGGVRFRQKHAP